MEAGAHVGMTSGHAFFACELSFAKLGNSEKEKEFRPYAGRLVRSMLYR
jgi:hypothetical protein